MKPKELLAHNQELTTRVKELESQLELAEQTLARLHSTPRSEPGKSQRQAEAALKLLQAGPVTVEQLKEINPKYPSDPIYFIRTVLKHPVVTHRDKNSVTTYSLPAGKSDQKPESPSKSS
jgi:hypothetical protein